MAVYQLIRLVAWPPSRYERPLFWGFFHVFARHLPFFLIFGYNKNKAMNYDPKHLDLEIEGIDFKDYPDFSDAFFSRGTYKGRELTEKELEELSEDGDLVQELIWDYIH